MEQELKTTNPENLNTLNLKITNVANFKPTIYVDDKMLKYKRDNFGGLTTTYKTEKTSVKVEIKKLYDINGPLWFLTSLFFFVISIFGIFDLKPDKKCYSVVASFNINVTKNCNLKIKFKPRSQSSEQAFELEQTDCEITGETGNKYFVDEVAKKRYKIMRIVKICCWVALFIVIALIVLKKASVF